MAAGSDSQPKKRLNPFIFPSETTMRFTLLVIAALLLAFNEGLNLGFVFNLIDTPTYPSTDIMLTDPGAVEQGLIEWKTALRQSLRIVTVPSGFTVSVLFLAMIIYRSYPGRIRRRRKLNLLTRDNDPSFFDAVHELIAHSGVSPAPSIEIAPNSKSASGQAFGLFKQYALRLDGGTRLLFRKNAAHFRAIILHELAHIANADITRTYFAQAIWMSTLLLVAIPSIALILSQLSKGFLGIPEFFILLLQFGGTLAIVAAIRSSLLRTREIYADWRAAIWGAREPLTDIFERSLVKQKAGFRALWRLHPSNQMRLETLDDPARLFRVTNELPFFVGALLGYALTGAIFFVAGIGILLIVGPSLLLPLLLAQALPDPLFLAITVPILQTTVLVLSILALSLFGFWLMYLITGSLGLEVQREALADMIAKRAGLAKYFILLKPALSTVAGFTLGLLLTPRSILVSLPTASAVEALTVILMVLLLTGTVLVSLWLWLIYVRYFAKQVFGSLTSISSVQKVRRVFGLASTGLLLVMFVPIILGVVTLEEALMSTGEVGLPQMEAILFMSSIIVLPVYLITFGVSWVLIRASKWIFKPRCPVCGNRLSPGYTIGRLCENCGHNPASWIFVT